MTLRGPSKTVIVEPLEAPAAAPAPAPETARAGPTVPSAPEPVPEREPAQA
jgi:hypothetical protein